MRALTRRLLPVIILFSTFFSGAALAVPGDVLYAEDFESGGAGGWTVAGGDGTSGVGEFPAGGGENSLFTCCGTVDLRSPVIDTTVPGAQVSLTLQRGAGSIGSNSPEGNEDLDVYFLDDNGSWQFIARLDADGGAGEMLNEVFVLDPEFLHAAFRVRLYQRDGNNNSDYWHLHEIEIVEAGASGGLGSLCDSFDGGRGNWSVTSYGGDAAVTAQTANTGSESLALFGGSLRILSLPLDLADAADATLTLWVRRGDDSFSEDPDGGEDLAIGYIDDTGNYQPLDQLAGAGTPGQVFDLSYALPADALHDAFQVRIDLYSGNGGNNDYWHIDDVCVAATRSVHHFAFDHDGSGVNCQAEPVRLVAHDGNHFVVENFTGAVTLSTDTARGDWGLISGGGLVTNAGNGSGSYGFVAADEGDVVLALRDTFVESVNLDAIGAGVVEDAGEDDDIAFAEAGFNFLVDGSVAPIGAQIAGKSNNVAPGASAVELQAIRTNDETGACEAALTGSTNIGVAFTCEDPSSCAGTALAVNGTPVGGNPAGVPAAFAAVALDFGNDTDATAPIAFAYPDAGRIRLHARLQLDPSGETMAGSSAPFVVRPFGFDIVAAANPGATGATGPAYRKAGEDFTVNVRAVAWQAGDDMDNDGMPDGHDNNDASDNADLSDNAALPNFGNESVADEVALSANLWRPSGGSHPGLSGTTVLGGFASGAATGSASYGEAGIIEIGAALSDSTYLGASDITSRSGPVGRFTPDHFDVAIDGHGCSDTVPLTYSGQPLQALEVIARNAGGDTTSNFDGSLGFARDVTISETSGAPGTVVNSGIAAADFAAGSVTVGSAPAGIGFTFAVKESPPVSVRFRATDSDSVSSAGHAEPETTIRSARLMIDDANAVLVTEAIARIEVQTWDGAEWVADPDDACTTIDAAGFVLSNHAGNLAAGESLVDTDPSLTFLSAGVGQVTLTAPGPGNDGSLSVTYDVPAWVEYDWSGSGAEDDAAVVTFFDIYRTESGFIQRVEIVP